jgi:hypothetical protein
LESYEKVLNSMKVKDRVIEVYGSQLIVSCPSPEVALKWAEEVAKLSANTRRPASRYAWDRDMWPKEA